MTETQTQPLNRSTEHNQILLIFNNNCQLLHINTYLSSHVALLTCSVLYMFQSSEHALWNTMNKGFFWGCKAGIVMLWACKDSHTDKAHIFMLRWHFHSNAYFTSLSRAYKNIQIHWLNGSGWTFYLEETTDSVQFFHTSLSFIHFHFRFFNAVPHSILHDACSHETRDHPHEIWSQLSAECKCVLLPDHLWWDWIKLILIPSENSALYTCFYWRSYVYLFTNRDKNQVEQSSSY